MKSFFFHWKWSNRFSGDVEEARSTAATVEIGPPEEVLLSMTGDLGRSTSFHEIPRNSSPISFANLLQSQKEQLVLFLSPWNSSLALAIAGGVIVDGLVGGGVTGGNVGGGGRDFGRLLRLLVLRQIVHAHAFPHGIHLHPHPEQHDLATESTGVVGTSLRAAT